MQASFTHSWVVLTRRTHLLLAATLLQWMLASDWACGVPGNGATERWYVGAIAGAVGLPLAGMRPSFEGAAVAGLETLKDARHWNFEIETPDVVGVRFGTNSRGRNTRRRLNHGSKHRGPVSDGGDDGNAAVHPRTIAIAGSKTCLGRVWMDNDRLLRDALQIGRTRGPPVKPRFSDFQASHNPFNITFGLGPYQRRGTSQLSCTIHPAASSRMPSSSAVNASANESFPGGHNPMIIPGAGWARHDERRNRAGTAREAIARIGHCV